MNLASGVAYVGGRTGEGRARTDDQGSDTRARIPTFEKRQKTQPNTKSNFDVLRYNNKEIFYLIDRCKRLRKFAVNK